MARDMVKGDEVRIPEALEGVVVEMGWRPDPSDTAAPDLDASVYCLGADGRLRRETDFVHYRNPRGADGAVAHLGDNLAGRLRADGESEAVRVDLRRVPPDVVRVAFATTILAARSRGHDFGQVKNVFVKVVDLSSGLVVARYAVVGPTSSGTSMVLAELRRVGDGWVFEAGGEDASAEVAALSVVEALPRSDVPSPDALQARAGTGAVRLTGG